MYVLMAWSISVVVMYSSAVCERAESPGPSFSEGHGMSAWSLSVGEPNGVSPSCMHCFTMGCWGLICEDSRRVERALTSASSLAVRVSRISWLV